MNEWKGQKVYIAYLHRTLMSIFYNYHNLIAIRESKLVNYSYMIYGGIDRGRIKNDSELYRVGLYFILMQFRLMNEWKM